MRSVCSYCSGSLVVVDAPGDGVSHGLCGDCAPRLVRAALLGDDEPALTDAPPTREALDALIGFWAALIDASQTWLAAHAAEDPELAAEIDTTRQELLGAVGSCSGPIQEDPLCCSAIVATTIANQSLAMRLANAIATVGPEPESELADARRELIQRQQECLTAIEQILIWFERRLPEVGKVQVVQGPPLSRAVGS